MTTAPILSVDDDPWYPALRAENVCPVLGHCLPVFQEEDSTVIGSVECVSGETSSSHEHARGPHVLKLVDKLPHLADAYLPLRVLALDDDERGVRTYGLPDCDIAFTESTGATSDSLILRDHSLR